MGGPGQPIPPPGVLVSGMGFFTDAYDLFVIGIVSTLLKPVAPQHRPARAAQRVMLGAAFLGALVFGRLADMIGRTRVYWMAAALMVVGAVGSALSPSWRADRVPVPARLRRRR